MAEKDIVRKLVPFKNVVKEPGFNYRKNLPPVPDDVKELIRATIKHHAKGAATVFDWVAIGTLISDNKTLNPAQRRKLTLALKLAQNIYNRGLITPLLVRESGAALDGNRTYFLVAGERRHLACEALGMANVEIKVTKGNAAELKIDRLSENIQRDDPDPFEEAEALEEFLIENPSYSQMMLAGQLGVSEAYISQRRSLLKRSTPEVREAVESELISVAHVREMITLPPKEQNAMLAAFKEKLAAGEKVSAADVRDVTDIKKMEKKAEKKAAAKKADGVQVAAAKVAPKVAAAGGGAEKASKAEPTEKQALNADLKELGYDPAMLVIRSKTEILSSIRLLNDRLPRTKTDRSRFEIKGQIAYFEWLTGTTSALGK